MIVMKDLNYYNTGVAIFRMKILSVFTKNSSLKSLVTSDSNNKNMPVQASDLQ